MITCDKCGDEIARHYKVTVADTEPSPPPGVTTPGRVERDLEIPVDLCLSCRSDLPRSVLELLLSPPSTTLTSTIELTASQAATLKEAQGYCDSSDPTMTTGRCIQVICTEWMRVFKEKEQE